MSIATITAAQRVEMRDALLTAANVMQRFAQDARTPSAAEVAETDAVLDEASAVLIFAGQGILATQVVVTNGDTVNVENSAGALDSNGTAAVAGGALTNVRLASTKTILTNALKFSGVTITGSGTFFTPTIVNGVLTGGVLSAS